jgi:hypothetical protein
MNIEPKHQPVLCGASIKKKIVININLSYIDFFRKNIDLKKYKIVELKSIAKFNKLYRTGTKPVLITRIINHFNLMKHANKIQSIMKGYFVRKSFQLRGEAFDGFKDTKRNICVNETDFYTLEPIQDIPFQEFFSYTDSKNFVYGFNIHSLITLYRKKRFVNECILNPYNRDIIDIIIKSRIFNLYNYIKIVFPDHKLEEDTLTNGVFIPIRSTPTLMRPTLIRPTLIRPIIPILDLPIRTTTPQNTVITTPMRINERNNLHEILNEQNIQNQDIVINDNLNEIRTILVEIRRKPIETRIQELFMEIDQLGHYTNFSWFSSLGKRNFYLFYLTLQELWLFRAHIPSDIKTIICPLGNPFLNIPTRLRYDEYTEEEMCRICLYVMENIILTSFDIEYRKIGAFQVLTALTVHSLPARDAMIWLYESIF